MAANSTQAAATTAKATRTVSGPALYVQAVATMNAVKNKRGAGTRISKEQFKAVVKAMSAKPEKYGTSRQAMQVAYFLGIKEGAVQYGPLAFGASTWKSVWLEVTDPAEFKRQQAIAAKEAVKVATAPQPKAEAEQAAA